MSDDAPTRWRFRLQLLAGLAMLVLLLMVLRARSERAAIDRSREALVGTLRALVEVQEEHYARSGRYAVRLDSTLGWAAPPAVTLVFSADDDQNWRATATDSALTIPPTTCGVFLGHQSSSPHRAVLQPGVPACW